MTKNIDRLIINIPYEEPEQYRFYDRETINFHIEDFGEMSKKLSYPSNVTLNC